MKLNTNSNAYTITYATVVVVIVAFLLAFAYAGLKERSDSNERIDKKQQILAALNIRNVDKVQTEDRYKEVVMADEIVNARGQILKQGAQKDQDGFKVMVHTSHTRAKQQDSDLSSRKNPSKKNSRERKPTSTEHLHSR